MDSFIPDAAIGQSSGFIPDPSIANQGNSGLKPDQQAMALGHSNGLIDNMLSKNVMSNAQGVQNFAESLPGIGKGIVNSALKFGESAVAAPVDIARGAMGAQPLDTKFPAIGGGQPTIQSDAAANAGEVFEGKKSPISAAISAVGDTIGGALNFVGGELGGKAAKEAVPAVAKEVETALADRGTNLATKRIASTAETMTKGEREAAIKEGRMTPSGKFTPSATEKRAGELMKGKTFANPVKTLSAVKNEISSRATEAEDYLGKSGAKITNQEDYDAFEAVKSNAKTYMTETEAKVYDDQVGVFQKILKNVVGDSGYTTASYYKALKDFESNVTANLPKGTEALRVEGGAAKLQAAKDVRSVVRDMISRKNPEFKGKMFDIASLYDAQDNVISNAEQGGHSWAKRNPKKMAAISAAAGYAGYEEAKKIPGVGQILP